MPSSLSGIVFHSLDSTIFRTTASLSFGCKIGSCGLTQSRYLCRGKFERYGAFLTGRGLLHTRVQEPGTRPVVIFTNPNWES